VIEARLILVRHCETEWNREGRIQGYHSDSPLTAKGQTQAFLLAARLAGERLQALHSSDAGRARQTATPIAAAAGVDVLYHATLRERNYGAFEGRTYREIETESPEAYAKFRSRDPDYAPPGGESGAQFRDRVVAALERVAAMAEGRLAAVITHGGVLGIVYRYVTGMPLDSKRHYSLHNASVNRIVCSGGRWSLEAWGDVAHLPESIDKP
jgi:2,3-bisphosphoglycerate-dependent phosphoglycerate mutase